MIDYGFYNSLMITIGENKLLSFVMKRVAAGGLSYQLPSSFPNNELYMLHSFLSVYIYANLTRKLFCPLRERWCFFNYRESTQKKKKTTTKLLI